MSDKMREAFNALIAQGHMVGFDDFRTGWESHEALADHSGDADEMVPPVKDSLTADSQQSAAVVELPYTWTGCADADTALILIGRIDAPDDQLRLDQLEQLVLNMGNSIAKQSGGGA